MIFFGEIVFPCYFTDLELSILLRRIEIHRIGRSIDRQKYRQNKRFNFCLFKFVFPRS